MHDDTRTTGSSEDAAASVRPAGGLNRLWVLPVVAVVLAATAAVVALRPGAPPPTGPAALVPPNVATVQNQYATDLVARINAERAARSQPALPVPPLQEDPALVAAAQAWSAHLAAVGSVADPPLLPCTGPGGSAPAPGQVCAFAANSGDTGNGFWPGDGSDGMDSDYMGSAPHRQNMLNAAYTSVGVGVTCAGGQAWTVELFGYAYGSYPAALARQSAQTAAGGNPLAASPVVAGTQTGDPYYCPGQVAGPNGQTSASGGQIAYPYAVPAVPGEPAASPSAAVGLAATADGQGYWVAKAGGAVTAHGDAVGYGSMASATLAAPVTHIVATTDGKGYWLVAADGGIFAFGDAGFYGSMGGKQLNAPVVDMAPTADGKGYWLVAADGGIFAFGDAVFHGSMGGKQLNAPVVGVTADGSGGGYWLVAADGGIFTFGDAAFHGSAGGLPLVAPVVGLAADPTGGGYWLVASDGGVFAYGAPFEGAG